MVKEIDIRLDLPPVKDYKYADPAGKEINESTEEDADGLVFSLEDGAQVAIDYVDPSMLEKREGLLPPYAMQVIEQNTRQTADGRTVVDVVVDVLGPPEAATYEARISKQ